MPTLALHRWHRRAGVAAAAFLIYLLGTGVPLQFSAALGLGHSYVGFELILDWYGLEPPRDVWASEWLVSVGDQLFTAPSAEHVGTLAGFRGAVTLDRLTAVAGEREVLLLAPGQSEPLDRFPLQTPISRIGSYHGQAVVDTSAGLLLSDPELVNWDPAVLPAAAVKWSQRHAADDPARYRQQFRQRMLTVERLLQDAHSGRILGTAGIVLVDAASVLLTFLAVSGLMMWWRTFRS